MDFLTHLFLPITVAYVLRPDLFPTPAHLTLAVFAVLPDFDKLVGLQGASHSAITLGGLVGGLVVLERWQQESSTYAVLVGALLFSHLLLDVLDGGPVSVLYPLIDAGVGLQYPTQLVIGETISGTSVQQPLPTVNVRTPTQGRVSYPLVNGYGVLSALTFLVLYASQELSNGRATEE